MEFPLLRVPLAASPPSLYVGPTPRKLQSNWWPSVYFPTTMPLLFDHQSMAPTLHDKFAFHFYVLQFSMISPYRVIHVFQLTISVHLVDGLQYNFCVRCPTLQQTIEKVLNMLVLKCIHLDWPPTIMTCA